MRNWSERHIRDLVRSETTVAFRDGGWWKNLLLEFLKSNEFIQLIQDIVTGGSSANDGGSEEDNLPKTEGK